MSDLLTWLNEIEKPLATSCFGSVFVGAVLSHRPFETWSDVYTAAEPHLGEIDLPSGEIEVLVEWIAKGRSRIGLLEDGGDDNELVYAPMFNLVPAEGVENFFYSLPAPELITKAQARREGINFEDDALSMELPREALTAAEVEASFSARLLNLEDPRELTEGLPSDTDDEPYTHVPPGSDKEEFDKSTTSAKDHNRVMDSGGQIGTDWITTRSADVENCSSWAFGSSSFALFLSDFHLCDGTAGDDFMKDHASEVRPHAGKDLTDTFAAVFKTAEKRALSMGIDSIDVVLAGDTVDMWEARARAEPIRHRRFFALLERIAKKHSIYYVLGNHDPLAPPGPYKVSDRYVNTRLETLAQHGHQADSANNNPLDMDSFGYLVTAEVARSEVDSVLFFNKRYYPFKLIDNIRPMTGATVDWYINYKAKHGLIRVPTFVKDFKSRFRVDGPISFLDALLRRPWGYLWDNVVKAIPGLSTVAEAFERLIKGDLVEIVTEFGEQSDADRDRTVRASAARLLTTRLNGAGGGAKIRYVVLGHTHIPDNRGTYFNTGTWTPVLHVKRSRSSIVGDIGRATGSSIGHTSTLRHYLPFVWVYREGSQDPVAQMGGIDLTRSPSKYRLWDRRYVQAVRQSLGIGSGPGPGRGSGLGVYIIGPHVLKEGQTATYTAVGSRPGGFYYFTPKPSHERDDLRALGQTGHNKLMVRAQNDDGFATIHVTFVQGDERASASFRVQLK